MNYLEHLQRAGAIMAPYDFNTGTWFTDGRFLFSFRSVHPAV